MSVFDSYFLNDYRWYSAVYNELETIINHEGSEEFKKFEKFEELLTNTENNNKSYKRHGLAGARILSEMEIKSTDN